MNDLLKIKIFSEYLGNEAIKDNTIEIVSLSNIEKLISEGFKLNLKSVYNLSKDEIFDVAEEMRYNRQLGMESFRYFRKSDFSMSSESRNRQDLYSCMVSFTAETDSGLKSNWFRLTNSLGYMELKKKGYDVGSSLSYTIKGDFKQRLSLVDLGIAVNKI